MCLELAKALLKLFVVLLFKKIIYGWLIKLESRGNLCGSYYKETILSETFVNEKTAVFFSFG